MPKNDNSDYSDLGIIALILIIEFMAIISGTVLKNVDIRTFLAIPLVLFIPGYVLIAALFPKKDGLKVVERIALSFGLSIVVILLLGLLLNFTLGIKFIPILIVLYVYSISLLILAIIRRRKLPEDIRFSIGISRIFENIKNGLKPKNKSDLILTIILIVMIMSTIGTIYYTITTPKIGERFTEFYVLNTTRNVDYPVNLELNSSVEMLIGVVNHEYSPINYTLQITLNKNILTSEELILENNETWEKNVEFTPNIEGTDMKLEFLLFKENNLSTPYRTTHLWVSVI